MRKEESWQHGGQMPLNIKDPETHEMARELAAATGETITRAVTVAIRERLQKVRRSDKASPRRLADRLDEIADHCAGLPVLSDRSIEDILGYDNRGMPS
jgi:antitoxin VapB